MSKEKKLLDDIVGSFNKLTSGINDAAELFELSMAEEDWDTVEAVGQDVEEIEKEVAQLEFKRMFNQPMDSANCYLKSRQAQAAPRPRTGRACSNACTCATPNARASRSPLKKKARAKSPASSPARSTSRANGPTARFAPKTGIHRLVRKSPFDSNARRHTSFTSVYVYPEVDDSIEIEINPADLSVDVFRASGAGGQHIQKTESAVRIHHIPTGIITICQDDRSQHRNREKAMQQLKAKLYELEMRKRMEEQTKLEESKSDIGWGHQIRSYVLDQSRVKDLRTNVETGNTGAVLDGDLDQFIEASLKNGVAAA